MFGLKGAVALCGFGAVSLGTAAIAQDVSAQTAQDDEGARSSGDIVVTAQRREERLRDVPISVSAVSGRELQSAGISSSRDLQFVAPGLRIEAVGAYVQPAIRGVTTSLTRGEANIATYIDGVYQPAIVAATYSLSDVNQVEVLKGPQGTLFGRNATGGAILIHTRDPNLGKSEANVTVGAGNFGALGFKGFASAPIDDGTLAWSATGFYEASDGWKRNLALGGGRKKGDISNGLARLKLRFAPFDGVDLILSATYSRLIDRNVQKLSVLDGNTSAASYLRGAGLPIADEPWQFAMDVDAVTRATKKSASLRGEFEIGPGALKTTTAYDDVRTISITDNEQSLRPTGFSFFNDNLEAFSQEVLYTTDKMERLSANIGVFYFWSHAGYEPFYAPNLLSNTTRVNWTSEKAESWAVFGDINYEITDALTLTGGLRYSRETRSASALLRTLPGVSQTRFERPALDVLGEKTWASTTPRVSLLLKASADTNFYLTASRGFKSGLFNAGALQAAPVDPETITAYEGGIKGSIGSLSYTAAVFHYDYEDLQVPVIQSINGALVSSLTNAAKARIRGIEISGGWKPAAGLNIAFGGTYLHARYASFPSAVGLFPTGAGGNASAPVDAQGNVLPRSPAWTGNLSGSYVIPSSAGDFEVSGAVYYSSRVYFDSIERVSQAPYATVNAALAWRPHDGPLELRLWGRNLTRRAVIASTLLSNAYDGIEYGPPRQYGVEASMRF